MSLFSPFSRMTRASAPHWTGTIIGVMIAIIAIIVASFGYVASQESRLRDGRLESRNFRMARQALMEADVAVLNAMATGATDNRAYYAAIDKLATHDATHFPRAVVVEGRVVSGAVLVRTIEQAWRAIMASTDAGDLAAARAAYRRGDVKERMTAVVARMIKRIEQLDGVNDAAQANIDWTIKAVVLLQLVSGLFGIAVFLVTARRSAVETAARARAAADATRSRAEVMLLFDMTDMLQSAQDQNDANQILRATALELLPDLAGTLYVFNNSRDRLVLSASWNQGDGTAPVEAITLNQCWALKRGKPHLNLPTADRLCCEHHAADSYALEIPMTARGEVLGLLCLRATGSDGQARLQEIAGLGAALADAMSLALANLALGDKLRSQALRDPLTGLYNRRYMEDTLQRSAQLAQRSGQALSVIMIDLDHFKRLNDQFGHAKGDAVLRDTAAAITSQLRESDVACRYGGEELLVVLPDCGLEDAAHKAERLRVAIAALSGADVAVSASFGVAAMPATAVSVRDLLHTADTALYAAKERGRNRVVAAPELADASPPQLLAAE